MAPQNLLGSVSPCQAIFKNKPPMTGRAQNNGDKTSAKTRRNISPAPMYDISESKNAKATAITYRTLL
jgi:hypothetical protein